MNTYNSYSEGRSQQGKSIIYRKRGQEVRCGVCKTVLKNKDEVVKYLPREYGHINCLYKDNNE